MVVGVGDEELVLGSTASEAEARSLSRAELVARLRAVLEQVRQRSRVDGAPAPSGAGSAAAAGSAPVPPAAAALPAVSAGPAR